MGLDKGYRSTHINELEYDEEGKIKPVTADFVGVEPAGTLDPFERVNAATIAWLSGVGTRPNGNDGTMQLTAIDDGDWTAVGNVDFSDGASGFTVGAVSSAGGSIELRLDSADGELIGTVNITGTDGTYEEYSCDIGDVSGTHDLFLVFRGSGSDIFEVASWQFEK